MRRTSCFLAFGRVLRAAALGIPFILSGCSSVTMLQHLPPSASADEIARFEGEWVVDDQILYLRFGSDGVGHFAGVDWSEGRFTLDEGEVVVSRGKERSFLSVRVKEEGKWDDEYFIAEYWFAASGDLVVWTPVVGAFIKAVEGGTLAGRVEEGQYSNDVVITSTPEQTLTFLDDPSRDDLFDYKEPMIFTRLRARCGREGSRG